MKKSLKVGSVYDIGIYLHWTFLLLVAGIVGFFYVQSGSLASAVSGIGLTFGVFGCVVLHELGHALMARRFHVPTQSITLYPIGGLARLERIPSEPMKEFWIAVAGPAVNIAIALILGTLILAAGGSISPSVLSEPTRDPLPTLVWLNVGLALFNLLPAFPMDGGRVLRSLLALRQDYAQATQMAANVGQGMAILFGLIGLLMLNPILLFIALFVYVGAQRESQQAIFRAFTHDTTVRQAMMTRFSTLGPSDTLDDAVDALLAGSDHDFPIIETDASGTERLRGILRRQALIHALSARDPSDPVADVADEVGFTVEADEMLDDVFSKMNQTQCSTVPVLRDGEVVGLLTLENVGELVMVASALERRSAASVSRDLSPSTSVSAEDRPVPTSLSQRSLPSNAPSGSTDWSSPRPEQSS